MNSLTAAWAMRSKRPATVLIIQFPRRSSESQPYTAGTSGHFSIERNTISSIGPLVCSKSSPPADQPRMKREDFTFVHSLRVRWAEVDRQDVVFHGHYFLYFDVAVAEYWRAVGFRYPQDIVENFGTDIYAVKASAEYHGSATYDELIDIGCRVGRIGRSSMQLVFGIWRGAEHITSGELIYVNADPKTRKSAPWPEPFRRAILDFERTRPAEANA